MAQVTLFKYLIISNNYFTMKGFTDKDGVLVIIFANILIYMWQKFQPCQTSPSVFPPQNVIFWVKIMKVLIPGQHFGIFASSIKGMDTFLFEMSIKWMFTLKNFRNVYWHGKTHSAMIGHRTDKTAGNWNVSTEHVTLQKIEPDWWEHHDIVIIIWWLNINIW